MKAALDKRISEKLGADYMEGNSEVITCLVFLSSFNAFALFFDFSIFFIL